MREVLVSPFYRSGNQGPEGQTTCQGHTVRGGVGTAQTNSLVPESRQMPTSFSCLSTEDKRIPLQISRSGSSQRWGPPSDGGRAAQGKPRGGNRRGIYKNLKTRGARLKQTERSEGGGRGPGPKQTERSEGGGRGPELKQTERLEGGGQGPGARGESSQREEAGNRWEAVKPGVCG